MLSAVILYLVIGICLFALIWKFESNFTIPEGASKKRFIKYIFLTIFVWPYVIYKVLREAFH